MLKNPKPEQLARLIICAALEKGGAGTPSGGWQMHFDDANGAGNFEILLPQATATHIAKLENAMMHCGFTVLDHSQMHRIRVKGDPVKRLVGFVLKDDEGYLDFNRSPDYLRFIGLMEDKQKPLKPKQASRRHPEYVAGARFTIGHVITAHRADGGAILRSPETIGVGLSPTGDETIITLPVTEAVQRDALARALREFGLDAISDGDDIRNADKVRQGMNLSDMDYRVHPDEARDAPQVIIRGNALQKLSNMSMNAADKRTVHTDDMVRLHQNYHSYLNDLQGRPNEWQDYVARMSKDAKRGRGV